MNNIVLLSISMTANLFGGIIKKDINNKYENNLFSYQFFNYIVSFISAFVLLALASSLKVSSFTVVLALVFGLITLIQQITNLMALEKGPFSYTSVIISLSTLIPTLSGSIWWEEQISYLQYIGIAFLIISLVLSVDFGKKNSKTNIKWLIYCFTAFICTGLIGVMQKIHQTSVYKDELDSFLIIAFIISGVFSLILSLIFRNKRHINVYNSKKNILSIKPIAFMIISGVFVALNNKFNLYLSGVMDSAVFFPLVNGGGLVLTSIAAIALFKEKLSVLQAIGLIFGIVSVVLLCLS